MKNRIVNFGLVALLMATLTSCEAIGDIFQAGMGVGIFLVVVVIILIFWLLRKFRR